MDKVKSTKRKASKQKDTRVQFQEEDSVKDVSPIKSSESEQESQSGEDIDWEGFVAPDYDDDFDLIDDADDDDDNDNDDDDESKDFNEGEEAAQALKVKTSQRRHSLQQRQRRLSQLPFSDSYFRFDPDNVSLTTISSERSLAERGSSNFELAATSAHFLENFGELPPIGEVASSVTSLHAVTPHEVATVNETSEATATTTSASKPNGNFVDPMTGKYIASEPIHFVEAAAESDGLLEEAAGGDVSSEKGSEDDFGCAYHDKFSLTDIDKMYSLDNLASGVNEERADEQEYRQMWQTAVRIDSIPALEAETVVERRESLIEEGILSFFDHILDEVFKRQEEERSRQDFAKQLDKKVLYSQLLSLSQEYFYNRKISQFLNLKAVEHFRRKGAQRQMLAEDKDDIGDDKDFDNYTSMREHLNELLGAEAATARKSDHKIQELELVVKQEEKNVKREVQNFESLVRSALKRDEMPHLQREVERGLQHVGKLRAEISDVRSVVIQRQHTLGRLNEKIDRIQDLGEGFHLTDYEHLMTQVQELEKKYEERICDLSKSHDSFQHNVHALGHMKLKSEILYKQMQRNIAFYNSNLAELKSCRSHLFTLNTKKVRISQQLSEIRMRIGLMDKPDLLRDYDKTAKLIAEKKKVIAELRKTRLDLEKKIKKQLDRMPAAKASDKKVVQDSSEQGFFVKGVQIGI